MLIIQSGNKNLKNPFIYWTVEQNRTLKPDDPDLPPEWCGLEQVSELSRCVYEGALYSA